jgi:hypothetical protein
MPNGIICLTIRDNPEIDVPMDDKTSKELAECYENSISIPPPINRDFEESKEQYNEIIRNSGEFYD